MAGRSIADLLDLTVSEALTVFAEEPAILVTLQVLEELGLGYLHLGESTPALSGGEAQRLKLATYLEKSRITIFSSLTNQVSASTLEM